MKKSSPMNRMHLILGIAIVMIVLGLNIISSEKGYAAASGQFAVSDVGAAHTVYFDTFEDAAAAVTPGKMLVVKGEVEISAADFPAVNFKLRGYEGTVITIKDADEIVLNERITLERITLKAAGDKKLRIVTNGHNLIVTNSIIKGDIDCGYDDSHETIYLGEAPINIDLNPVTVGAVLGTANIKIQTTDLTAEYLEGRSIMFYAATEIMCTSDGKRDSIMKIHNTPDMAAEDALRTMGIIEIKYTEEAYRVLSKKNDGAEGIRIVEFDIPLALDSKYVESFKSDNSFQEENDPEGKEFIIFGHSYTTTETDKYDYYTAQWAEPFSLEYDLSECYNTFFSVGEKFFITDGKWCFTYKNGEEQYKVIHRGGVDMSFVNFNVSHSLAEDLILTAEDDTITLTWYSAAGNKTCSIVGAGEYSWVIISQSASAASKGLITFNDTMTKANGATYRVEKNGNIIAEINSKLYFTVIPAEGYEIGTVSANGAVVSKINDSTYMVDNLQEQVILSAIFLEKSQVKDETLDEVPQSKNSKVIAGVENTTIKVSTVRLSSGKIKVKWTKSKGYKVDYYEIYRSTKKSNVIATKPVYTTKKGTSTSWSSSKGLKKGTKYYYKVRGVREIDGKKYYTKWSNYGIRTFKG